MRPRIEINLDLIQKRKANLLRLAELSKQDIKKMFFERNDEDIKDLDNMEYRWDLPLYAKHIFRFINGGSQVGGMYWGLDPNGQRIMRYYFGFRDENYESMELMDFICWMKNSLGSYDIVQLGNDLEKSQLVQSWEENCITFFFQLAEEKQLKLISEYNKMNQKYENINLE